MEHNIPVQTHPVKTKYLYIECLRILAAFFVIFNHTGYEGFLLFTQREPGSLPFWLYLFFAVFCKFSVGLFFALSGALMLGREQESLSSLWKQRISRMFLVLFIFSILYYINRAFLYKESLSIGEFLRMFYQGGTEGHLWYLYGHISFLISLPFFRAMVKHLENKYYYYMIALFIGVFGLLPIIEYLLWKGTQTISWHISVPWLSVNTVFYPLLGYFLHHKTDIHKSKKWILPLWITNAAGILLSSYMTYYKGIQTGVFSSEASQTFLGSLSAINIICIFLTVRYLLESKDSSKDSYFGNSEISIHHQSVLRLHIDSFVKGLIASIGSCTFGIYLLHVFVLKNPLSKQALTILLNTGMNDMLAVTIQCLGVFFVCYGIVWLWKKFVFNIKQNIHTK